uniref:Reverse transcriptase domain-containing protein n=1 Tax=Tanacetum cinerariifolium TaxID=118510 RepID=A0A6L2JSQ8_TANCI|nr:reverse transcriptase domain-containing protein [Tanacetum cinerariifolium]
MQNGNSIGSIVRRLCLATCVYLVWQERNNRIFRDETRSIDNIFTIFNNIIQWRLSSLKVKKTQAVLSTAEIWDIKFNTAGMERHELHERLCEIARRRDLKKRLGSGQVRSMTGSPEPRRDRFESPRKKDSERRTVFKRLEKGVFHRLGDKGKSMSAYSNESRRRSYHSNRGDIESCYQSSRSRETEFASEKSHNKRASSRRMEPLSGSEDSAGGHWKSKPKRQKSSIEDDLSQLELPPTEKNASRIWSKFITSSREMGNPRKILCGEVRWRLIVTNERSHYRLGNNKKLDTSKTSRREAFRTNRGQRENRTEKRNASKFCKFHREIGHTIDEYMHLKRQIEEMLKAGKLSHLIKELKQNNGKYQTKATKKGGNMRKGQAAGNTNGEEDGTEGPMIIEAKMGGHFVHRTYVDGGSSLQILYEHCFNRFRREICDEEHSTSAWMNFMVVRLSSLYNGIIGRLGVRRIQAVSSTAHGMLKFPVIGKTVTLRSSGIIPLECTMVSGPGAQQPVIYQAIEEKIQDVYLLDKRKIGQSPERNKAIYEEVEKLVDVGIMKEVHYHSWLSNPVMVKKHDGNWRMCVDFKDLNKASLKDGYSLPEIDWNVESLSRYPFKCFLDAYKGYHQIKIAKEDEEKTTFVTSQGIFCYSKMPFGLKNVGATYQRLVDKAFQKQIGRNLEVYVDDLVIKSRMKQEVIRDIEETFKTLREINMKLKPKNGTFGMREGMFLGYKVNADGLKVCPDKVEAKCTKKSDFLWTAEAKTTFKQIKKLIAKLPMLIAPKEKEELVIYLAAAKEAISAALMTERDEKQMPIYLVSRALQGPKINYTPMEKLILALKECSNGGLRLKEHDIHYRLRTSVKGQILADFIVEHPEDDPPNTPMKDKEELSDPWILFTDGSSRIDGSGAGLIITNLKEVEFTYALRFRFDATNNEVEYEALIAGLRIAKQMGVKNLQANVDSRLVSNKVNGTYIAKEPDMVKYLKKVKNLTSTFKEFSIKQVPRGENKKADTLSKMASTSFAHQSKQVLVEELKEKSIDEKEVLAVVEEERRT